MTATILVAMQGWRDVVCDVARVNWKAGVAHGQARAARAKVDEHSEL